ncbi:uncharacterized protein si:dkey-197j19.5 [Hoplias malabaricus]|uniref:uncharacterized protein si:dkey-197j19.5 n=1 Tax=Hoplias malabaricus TaxID=27720 RepID=UPI0034629474
MGVMQPELQEFSRLNNIELFRTPFYKTACRSLGPPKGRQHITVKPPTRNFTHPVTVSVTVPVLRARRDDPPDDAAGICEPGADPRTPSYPRERGLELGEWIRERRTLRRALDRLGELDTWLNNKPTLTDLEVHIMERRRETSNVRAPSQLHSDMEGLRAEKGQAGLQMVSKGSMTHTYSSTLEGSTGRAVECFRTKALGEYRDSLEQCRRHELPISQASLQRAFLHPEDVSVCKGLALRQPGTSALQGHGVHMRGRKIYSNPAQERKEKEDEEKKEESMPRKNHTLMRRRQALSQRADPNAFWPGHNDHVHLYQPVISYRPESVIFHRVKHTPAPSPGHWPVNQAGYFTSGDINAHKRYTL